MVLQLDGESVSAVPLDRLNPELAYVDSVGLVNGNVIFRQYMSTFFPTMNSQYYATMIYQMQWAEPSNCCQNCVGKCNLSSLSDNVRQSRVYAFRA